MCVHISALLTFPPVYIRTSYYSCRSDLHHLADSLSFLAIGRRHTQETTTPPQFEQNKQQVDDDKDGDGMPIKQRNLSEKEH